MNEAEIKHHLEIATNAAVLLVAFAVLSAFSWGYFVQRRTPSLKSGLQKGELIAPLLNIDFTSSPQTLLVAMNTKCQFCTESIPFYNQLATSQRASNRAATHIIAIFPNDDSEVQQYTRQHQFQVDTVAGVNLNVLNVSDTPTLILVDSRGRIINFWVGKPSEEIQAQINKSISLPGA